MFYRYFYRYELVIIIAGQVSKSKQFYLFRNGIGDWVAKFESCFDNDVSWIELVY